MLPQVVGFWYWKWLVLILLFLFIILIILIIVAIIVIDDIIVTFDTESLGKVTRDCEIRVELSE